MSIPSDPAHLLDKTDFRKLVAEYRQETDRGAALLACAYAEEELETAIRKCLVKDSPLYLGPLKRKLQLAEALGLLPQQAIDDLRIVSDVRDAFAHRSGVKSFDDSQITKFCERTFIADHYRESRRQQVDLPGMPQTPRDLYFAVITFAVQTVRHYSQTRKAPVQPVLKPFVLRTRSKP